MRKLNKVCVGDLGLDGVVRADDQAVGWFVPTPRVARDVVNVEELVALLLLLLVPGPTVGIETRVQVTNVSTQCGIFGRSENGGKNQMETV